MAMNNVWCIRKYFGVNDSVAFVREAIAQEFLAEFESTVTNRLKQPQKPYIPIYLRNMYELHKTRLNHLPEHWPDTRRHNSVRCVVCKASKTSLFCVRCNVHLHAGECYYRWHNVLDL